MRAGISSGHLSNQPSDLYLLFFFFFLFHCLLFNFQIALHLLWCCEDRTRDLADGRRALHH